MLAPCFDLVKVSKFWHWRGIVSVPYLTGFTIFLLMVSACPKLLLKVLNLKMSSRITMFKSFFASALGFSGV